MRPIAKILTEDKKSNLQNNVIVLIFYIVLFYGYFGVDNLSALLRTILFIS